MSSVMTHKQSRHTVIVLVVIVLALVGLRLALPSLVKNYLNDQLADMGDYQGHIVDVDIALLRSAYSIHGIKIIKVSEAVPVPFFEAEVIERSVSWRALLAGAVVADVAFIKPALHFVDDDAAGSQSGAGTDWRIALQKLVPIRIDRLGIHDGTLHFHNFTSEPSVHLLITELEGAFTHLSNADRRQHVDYARFQLDGWVLEDARASLEGNLDLLGDFRDFLITLKLTGIDLTRINDLTEAYAHFNFESGSGDFVMELEADDGQLSGYAKPVLDNVVVFDFEKDVEKGVLSAVWEATVGALGRVFRNHPKDRIASRIEIRGRLDQSNISAWQAFVSILRNAFVEAYDAQFDRK